MIARTWGFRIQEISTSLEFFSTWAKSSLTTLISDGNITVTPLKSWMMDPKAKTFDKLMSLGKLVEIFHICMIMKWIINQLIVFLLLISHYPISIDMDWRLKNWSEVEITVDWMRSNDFWIPPVKYNRK